MGPNGLGTRWDPLESLLHSESMTRKGIPITGQEGTRVGSATLSGSGERYPRRLPRPPALRGLV